MAESNQQIKVEPGYIYSGSDDVHKLTIFMTPAQWDALSAWSANLKPTDADNKAWLYMLHETKKIDEYKKTMQELTSLCKNEVFELYQTPSKP